MNINGHTIEKGLADKKVSDIKRAVEKIPFDDPLRPYFDFLLGYIEEASDFKDSEGEFDVMINEAIQNDKKEAYGELLAITI